MFRFLIFWFLELHGSIVRRIVNDIKSSSCNFLFIEWPSSANYTNVGSHLLKREIGGWVGLGAGDGGKQVRSRQRKKKTLKGLEKPREESPK